jgi:hypothetical protein
MTFGEMWGDVVHVLGLSTRATNDETVYAKRFVNDGVVDILSRCRPSNQYMNLGLQAGVVAHNLDPIVISLRDILFPNHGFLARLSREDAMRAQSVGGFGFAYAEPLLWVAPIVDVDTYVEAHGTFRPTKMTLDTHDPSLLTYGALAPEFHGAVVNYALWKTADHIQHASSSFGERWRLLYEGQDGLSGDVARIKRLVEKRSTQQGARRRDLTGALGSLSDSGAYTTNGG